MITKINGNNGREGVRGILSPLASHLSPLIMVSLWAVAFFLFFQFWYPYHFFFQEQNQIFLCSWDYAFVVVVKWASL